MKKKCCQRQAKKSENLIRTEMTEKKRDNWSLSLLNAREKKKFSFPETKENETY